MNEAQLHSFVGQVVADIAASMSGVMTDIEHKLGLYQAMTGAGPMTPMELAVKTGIRQRYILEWLNNQAAGGYVNYDSVNGTVLINSVAPRKLHST